MHKTTEETIKELRARIDELEASLKEDKFEYPICKKGKLTGIIVLFEDISTGKVLKKGKDFNLAVGANFQGLHTGTSIWEDYPYDKERGLYHKQMVYCWDNYYTHGVEIRFYDAINECVFAFDGYLSGTEFEYYSATMPEFMLEAHKTLKD